MANRMQRFKIPREAVLDDLFVDYRHALGGGADATVYAGTWTTRRRTPVAVKALHPELIQPYNEGREQFLARFREECLRLRDLHHENIVQFFGVCTTRDGDPGLVTEKMAETLEERYKSRQLSVWEQVEIFCDVAAGLTHLHDQGIMHRDLTTRNVLLTEKTRGGIAKLADVGLSRRLDGTDVVFPTRCPGSQLYMPPEALASPPAYDEKLDIFSFGVLMMSTINRRDPSLRLNLSPTTRYVDGVEHAIPEVERRASDYGVIAYHHPVKKLIGRCLANDPTQRPSASDVLHSLTGLRERLHRVAERQVSASIDCHQSRERIRSCVGRLGEARLQLAVQDEIIARKETSLHDKDSRIAVLESEKEELEEYVFIKFAQQYNRAQNCLSSGGASFPQWKKVNSPLPQETDLICKSAVHLSLLYVSSSSVKSGECHLFCTSDIRLWNALQPPQGSSVCDGLLSYDKRLFFLSQPDGVDAHGVLFELKHVNNQVLDNQGRLHTVWQQLRSGSSPIIQRAPALFADKGRSRIVMIGGQDQNDDPLSAVSEYCFSGNKRLNLTDYPPLPLPTSALTAVSLTRQVHLLGGFSLAQDGSSNPCRFVHSADIGAEDIREWKNDILPATPLTCCGASRIFQTIVVAGGVRINPPMFADSVYSDVYVLDQKNAKWLQLPSMLAARFHPSVIYYQHKLLVFGGLQREANTSVAEQLSLSYSDIL